MKRLAYGAWVAGAILLLAAVGSTVWLLTSTAALRLAWSIARPLLPGDIRIEALSGDLIGPITITGLELDTGPLRLSVERAEIRWRPSALLARELAVETLQLENVEVVRLPARAPAAGGIELPGSVTPPLAVTVDHVNVNGVTVRVDAAAKPLAIDRLEFGLHWDDRELRLRDTTIQSAQLDASGALNIAPRGDYAGQAEVDWVYRPAGYPPMRGTTRLSGTADFFRVTQHLDAPYSLDGNVSVAEPLTNASLNGELTLQLMARELGLDWPVTAAAGRLRITGSADMPAVSGDLMLIAPDLVDTRLEVVARLDGGALAVQSLRLSNPATTAAVQLTGRIGLAAQPSLELRGQWSSLQWPLRGEPLAMSRSGSLELSGTPQELRAEFAAEVAGGSVQGRLDRNTERLEVYLDWRDLAYPQVAPRLVSERGTLSIEGRPDDYRLAADAVLIAAHDTALAASGHVRASGSGNLDGLELEVVDIAMLDGTITGKTRLEWRPTFAANVDVDLHNVDPGALSATWPGRLGGHIGGTVTMDNQGLAVRADNLRLAGTLRDRPFDLAARGRWKSPTIAALDELALHAGGTSLTAQGTLDTTLDFTWNLSSESLDDLWPGLAGHVSTTGRLEGPRQRPFIHIDANGGDIVVGTTRVGALELMVELDTTGKTTSKVALKVRNSLFEERDIAALEVEGSGNAAQHELMAHATAEDADAEIHLTGAIDQPWEPAFVWSFNLERAKVGYPMFAPWVLRGRSSGRISAALAEIEEACWESLNASLCFDGNHTDAATTAHFALQQLPLQYFSAYFPDGGTATGTANASGQLMLVPGRLPTLDADLTTTSSWIGPIEEIADQEGGLAFAPGRAHIAWDVEALGVEVELPLEAQEGGIDLQATARRAEDQPFVDSTIEGNLRITLGDLSFVSDLIRGIEDTAGALSTDLRLSGTIAEPLLLGEATLSNATARLVDPGIVLENAEARLDADGSGGLGFAAQASSGGGTLSAHGTLRFNDVQPIGRIDITGTDFEFLNLPTIRAFASPELALRLEPDRADLTGRVLVPQASITLLDTTQDVVRVSPDQIIVDAQSREALNLARPLYARIGIELGEHVTFDGLGLKGRLEGALQLVETPTEPTSGTGELRIMQGTYVAYRQQLEIRTGRLLFAGGPVERPGLDIEAVRRPADDILVGARIRGTLEQPELVVFSEPPMPREEALSYLLLGRPLERTSTSESSALAEATMLLGLTGGDMLTERINRSLGFDEFGIRTQAGDTDTAAFVIGRYFAPSLYVSYGIGLFEQVNTLRLRYRITNRWRLETESSSENAGGDVIYHIERGQ